jgi:hypothetical protein
MDAGDLLDLDRWRGWTVLGEGEIVTDPSGESDYIVEFPRRLILRPRTGTIYIERVWKADGDLDVALRGIDPLASAASLREALAGLRLLRELDRHAGGRSEGWRMIPAEEFASLDAVARASYATDPNRPRRLTNKYVADKLGMTPSTYYVYRAEARRVIRS